MNKIVMLTTVHQAFDTRIFHKEAVSLAKSGYEVSIIAPHHREETSEGIKIIPIVPAKNRLLRFFKGITLLRKALREKAAVYHFHDPELVWVGLSLKLLTSSAVIYDAHEYYAESILSKAWIPKKLRPLISKLADFLEKRSARFLDGVVTATEMMEERFKIFNARTVTLNNYPVESCFRQPAGRCLPAAKKTVIYVGNINKIRGLEIIVQTVDLISRVREDFSCILAGKIDLTGVDPALLQRFNELKEKGCLNVLGHLNYDELFPLLQQSQAGWNPILPTPHYSLAVPTKVYEYMAAGLPLITGDFGPTAKLVRQYSCGCLVNPLDPKEHAEAIIRILTQENAARAMAERGYNLAVKLFSWAKEEQKLLSFYQEISAEWGKNSSLYCRR